MGRTNLGCRDFLWKCQWYSNSECLCVQEWPNTYPLYPDSITAEKTQSPSGYGAHMSFESLDISALVPKLPKFVENPMENFKATRISMIFAPRCSTCGSCRLRTKTGSSLDTRGFPWMSLPHRSLHHRVSVPWLALRNFGHQRGKLWFQAIFLFLFFSGCSNHFKAVLECEHQTTQTTCCFDTQSGSATPRRWFFSRHVIPLRTSKITFAPASFKAVANCSDDHTGTASRAVSGASIWWQSQPSVSPTSVFSGVCWSPSSLALVNPPNTVPPLVQKTQRISSFISLLALIMTQWTNGWCTDKLVKLYWQMVNELRSFGFQDVPITTQWTCPSPIDHRQVWNTSSLCFLGILNGFTVLQIHQTLILISSNYPWLIH